MCLWMLRERKKWKGSELDLFAFIHFQLLSSVLFFWPGIIFLRFSICQKHRRKLFFEIEINGDLSPSSSLSLSKDMHRTFVAKPVLLLFLYILFLPLIIYFLFKIHWSRFIRWRLFHYWISLFIILSVWIMNMFS